MVMDCTEGTNYTDVVVGTDSIDGKSSRMVQENICNNKSLLRAKKESEGDAVADER